MPKFMMLLHDSTTAIASLSPKEIGDIVQRYKAWQEKVARSGTLIGGEKLKDEGGKILSQQGGKVSVRDGAFAEAKEIIGGFFMIEAKDYADAVKLSEDCPHLAFGGRIELREVDAV